MRPQRLLDRPEAIDVIYATPEGMPRRFVLDSVEEKAPGQLLMRQSVTVEIEGESKPALNAEWLTLVMV